MASNLCCCFFPVILTISIVLINAFCIKIHGRTPPSPQKRKTKNSPDCNLELVRYVRLMSMFLISLTVAHFCFIVIVLLDLFLHIEGFLSNGNSVNCLTEQVDTKCTSSKSYPYPSLLKRKIKPRGLGGAGTFSHQIFFG